MYKLFLALRYLRKRRIAYFAVAAVALCTAMVLVVHSVMTGFLDSVRSSSRRLLGDVILEVGEVTTFPYYDEFIARVKSEMKDEVKAATPVIINYGLLKSGSADKTYTVMVTGIRLNEYTTINSFGEGLYYNKYYPGTTTFEPSRCPTWYFDEQNIARLPKVFEEARAEYQARTKDPDFQALYRREAGEPYPGPGWFMMHREEDLLTGRTDTREYLDDPLPGMIIGVDLAAYKNSRGQYERQIPKGVRVRLTTLAVTHAGVDALNPATTVVMRYVDDSNTRIWDIDSKTVYCDFGWLQKLVGCEAQERVDGQGMTPPRATQIQIKLYDGVDYKIARDKIRKLWDEFRTQCAEFAEPRDLFTLQAVQVDTWEERNLSFIRAVEKERILVVILFAIVSVVAVILVGCIPANRSSTRRRASR